MGISSIKTASISGAVIFCSSVVTEGFRQNMPESLCAHYHAEGRGTGGNYHIKVQACLPEPLAEAAGSPLPHLGNRVVDPHLGNRVAELLPLRYKRSRMIQNGIGSSAERI